MATPTPTLAPALTLQAPSTSLPPLKRLHSYSPALLALSVRALAQLYHPASTSSTATFVDSGYSSAPNPVTRSSSEDSLQVKEKETQADKKREEEEESEWTRLRNDQFERSFALTWLLSLITRGEDWLSSTPPSDHSTREDKERLLEDAAALLAACSRTAEAGSLRREYTFLVEQSGEKVCVGTKDESYSGEDHTAVGVQTWASSTILAELFAASPGSYGLPFGQSGIPVAQAEGYCQERPCRILELGAGTGVLSLLLTALATSHNPMKIPTEIVASDYHPSVLSNLSSNLLSNFPTQPPWVTLACDKLDWSVFSPSSSNPHPAPSLEPPFNEKFDIIVGADIIYEPAHVGWIWETVRAMLGPGGVFHLIMPQRVTHEVETALAREMFRPPSSSSDSAPASSAPTSSPSNSTFDASGGENRGEAEMGKTEQEKKEKVLTVTKYEETERRAGRGRSDEVKYMIWRMEWV